MTLLQLLHREEQMDAARAEFRREYGPTKRALQRHLDTKSVAQLEWVAWRAWVKQKMGVKL